MTCYVSSLAEKHAIVAEFAECIAVDKRLEGARHDARYWRVPVIHEPFSLKAAAKASDLPETSVCDVEDFRSDTLRFMNGRVAEVWLHVRNHEREREQMIASFGKTPERVKPRESYYDPSAFVGFHTGASEIVCRKDGMPICAVYNFDPGKNWAYLKALFKRIREECEPPAWED